MYVRLPHAAWMFWPVHQASFYLFRLCLVLTSSSLFLSSTVSSLLVNPSYVPIPVKLADVLGLTKALPFPQDMRPICESSLGGTGCASVGRISSC